MRKIHTTQYWEHKLSAENNNRNKSNRSMDPQNDEDLMNYQLAMYYLSQEQNSQIRLVS